MEVSFFSLILSIDLESVQNGNCDEQAHCTEHYSLTAVVKRKIRLTVRI